MFLISRVAPVIYFYLRPLIKWFLHRFTRLCELQRICYGSPIGACRSKEVEISLNLSKNKEIRDIVKDFDNIIATCNDKEFQTFSPRAVATVIQAKRIKPICHPDFPRLFAQCVEQIWGYKRLIHIVERLREIQYESDNLNHERKLLDLWKFLMPDDELESRVTKQWQDIGFQGDDPKTDFRGMGILGLENLLFFAQEYNDAARHVLLHSMHPVHGYTFSIVGINLTSMAYKLLKAGKAKTHFFNVCGSPATLEHFHKFYCYLFFEFDRFWMECEPKNIMEFPGIHQMFEENILAALEDNRTVFQANLSVERV